MGPCRLLLFRLWFLRGERDCGRMSLAPIRQNGVFSGIGAES